MPLLTKDVALLSAFRLGEQWALDEVYAFYSPRLRRYLNSGFSFESQGKICRFGGAAANSDLEWVVQETFVRGFELRIRKAYDGKRPFLRYLQTIARNLVLRELNRSRRHTVLEDGSAADSDAPVNAGAMRQINADPEQVAELKELQTILAGFMTELDPEEAEFVQVRFIEGKTQEATADAMGTTRARIKVLEANLRARFLELFRRHGYFAEVAPKPRWTRKECAAA